jgi:hypothetical protein
LSPEVVAQPFFKSQTEEINRGGDEQQSAAVDVASRGGNAFVDLLL